MNNQNQNNQNNNAGADPTTNPVALNDNAVQNYDGQPIQLCFLGSENSGKRAAQLHLLQQNGHEFFDAMREDSFDIQGRNALGNFAMSLQSVPHDFQALHDVVIRESDVFIIMYNRTCRDSFANARRSAERVLRIQEDMGPLLVFVGNSAGENMDYYNLPYWQSTQDDPVSRNEGLAFAEEFAGVYMETLRGDSGEISEAVSACLNLYINAQGQQDQEGVPETSRVRNALKKAWRAGVILSRPVRYRSRNAWQSARLSFANRFLSRTRA